MATNLVLCVRNAIDDATMSASPDMRSTLPPSNLQLPARGRVARSADATVAQDIKFTWNGAGYYLSMLMLSRHNLEPGAEWRALLYATADWTGAAVYDSGTVTAVDGSTLGDLDFGVDPLGGGEFDAWLGQQFSILYFTRVQALYGIVRITNTGNADGYLEASRLGLRPEGTPDPGRECEQQRSDRKPPEEKREWLGIGEAELGADEAAAPEHDENRRHGDNPGRRSVA